MQDVNKVEVEVTNANDKDKYEKGTKKIKKETKEKESNKKKYDKKSGNFYTCIIYMLLQLIVGKVRVEVNFQEYDGLMGRVLFLFSESHFI